MLIYILNALCVRARATAKEKTQTHTHTHTLTKTSNRTVESEKNDDNYCVTAYARTHVPAGVCVCAGARLDFRFRLIIRLFFVKKNIYIYNIIYPDSLSRGR